VHDILGMARTDVPLQTQYSVVRYGWVSILDAMVGACLTLGNRSLAAQYHQELLDMGAAPTANTFGLYITTLKESTKTFDEASEAVKIFHRAKSEGVEPSSFLYNALIGKLGKARRIDDCLFYFAEMRSRGIRPTSVTYGTIVNALCRVSDEKFAEELFEEMESMPNYKARPAPYNSLMQFFLTTKRDKSKVLSYYERMKSKGIQPTNHTYKLLIDTYATLEPVNMSAAEAVLDVIRGSGDKPEAVHYSSLIHAKGCVLHDLEGARAIFDAVLADPSIRPQACLYQALFESMVANHQFSDADSLLKNMSSRRVEMTPYIANTLIHGWANEKKIEKSKAIFEAVGRDRREPSTYEAMTRAYLAVEDRQSAKGVVQEMLSRGYPSAVSGKIMELVGGGNAGAC
jgi:pentatricopeptide repeat protein